MVEGEEETVGGGGGGGYLKRVLMWALWGTAWGGGLGWGEFAEAWVAANGVWRRRRRRRALAVAGGSCPNPTAFLERLKLICLSVFPVLESDPGSGSVISQGLKWQHNAHVR
jgi:hypothetical protein